MQKGGANFAYTKDHIGSIRELTDATGSTVSQTVYDSYGRSFRPVAADDSDYSYAGYYLHPRSNLLLTSYRAYNTAFGRWLNRDPIEERGGTNLFEYCGNAPSLILDPRGLKSLSAQEFSQMTGTPQSFWAYPNGMGCRSVVNFHIGLTQDGVPEAAPNTQCWYGSLFANLQAIIDYKCPCNTTPKIWTRQGKPIDSSMPTSGPVQGSPADLFVIQGSYNYAVFSDAVGSFIGASNRWTGKIYPQGTCPMNQGPGMITCVTCKKNPAPAPKPGGGS